MPENTMDQLVEAHKKAAHPNEEAFLLKKADSSGLYRVLKSSILKVKYIIPGSENQKNKQLSFAKLNGEVDNGTVPKMVAILSQMVDNKEIEIVDAGIQSNFIFAEKSGSSASAVLEAIYNERKKAEENGEKEVTN